MKYRGCKPPGMGPIIQKKKKKKTPPPPPPKVITPFMWLFIAASLRSPIENVVELTKRKRWRLKTEDIEKARRDPKILQLRKQIRLNKQNETNRLHVGIIVPGQTAGGSPEELGEYWDEDFFRFDQDSEEVEEGEGFEEGGETS